MFYSAHASSLRLRSAGAGLTGPRPVGPSWGFIIEVRAGRDALPWSNSFTQHFVLRAVLRPRTTVAMNTSEAR